MTTENDCAICAELPQEAQPLRTYIAAAEWLATLTNSGLADFVEDHLYLPLHALDPVAAVLEEVMMRLRQTESKGRQGGYCAQPEGQKKTA